MSLEEYIAQEMSEARLESTGRFSLDFLKARGKLERFRLPSPSHYLLKAVQAATLAGADEIRVKVLSDATILRFRPDPDRALARFESVTVGIQNPLEVEDPGVKAICQSLLGALLDPDESVVWRVNNPTGSDALWLGASGNRTESARYRAEPGVECVLTQSRPPNWKFWRSARDRARDALTLEELARHCPIPVRLEGRNLQGGWKLRKRTAGQLLPYFLFQTLWRGDRLALRPPPQSSFFREGEVFVYRPLSWHPQAPLYQQSVQGDTCYYYEILPDLSSPGEVLSVSMAAAVESHLALEAEVIFVCDGVCMQPISLDLGCKGLRIVACGQGLHLDASGFAVIQDDQFEARVPDFQRVAHHLRARVAQHLDRCCCPVRFYELDSSDDVRVTQYRADVKQAFA